MYSNKDLNSGLYVYFRVGGWDIEKLSFFLGVFPMMDAVRVRHEATRGVWFGLAGLCENSARQDSHANPSIVKK
jgi:hypothetical protein